MKRDEMNTNNGVTWMRFILTKKVEQINGNCINYIHLCNPTINLYSMYSISNNISFHFISFYLFTAYEEVTQLVKDNTT